MIAHIWTDGSANNKTHDNGGYGIFIEYRNENNHVVETVQIVGGRYSNTTSARMETKAVLEALMSVKSNTTQVTINCDCEHVVKTIDLGWIWRWKNERFINRTNKDLWIEIAQILELNLFTLKIRWVKGHADSTQNILADQLAKEGSQRKSNIIDQLYVNNNLSSNDTIVVSDLSNHTVQEVIPTM